MKFAWAMLLGGLMAGMAWGATPTEVFTVDSRVKTEQFRIRAKRLNTPIWRFNLKEGTNDWNATGWETIFHYAPSVDSAGKISVTGTVSTATVDFTLPTNFLGRAMKDGYAAVTVGKDAEIVTYAWGRITIEPAPEISAEGALPMRRPVYGPDYGPFLGDFEHWPFSTNALEAVVSDATLTGDGTAANPLSVVAAGAVTNATLLVYAGTNLLGSVNLDTDDFLFDGTTLSLKEYGWFADLAGDAGLFGRRRQGGTNFWETLGSMAEEAAGDYGKLSDANTWADTQTFAGTNFWAGGNVHYLPIDADINAYIASAEVQDGDVVELGAGTNTVTSTITIAKRIHLRGQGRGKTTIACSTALAAGRALIEPATNYVMMSDMGIALSGQSNEVNAIGRKDTYVNFTGWRFERLNVEVSGSSRLAGITTVNTDADIVDCDVSVTSSGNQVQGIRMYAPSGGTVSRKVNVYRSTVDVSGFSNTGACWGFTGFSALANYTNTLALYDCRAAVTNTGSDEAHGAITRTGADIDVYGGRYDAKTYDLYREGGVLTVHGSVVLANGTVSGTIAYAGTTEAGAGLSVGGTNFVTELASKISHAAADGKEYVSINGAWAEVSASVTPYAIGYAATVTVSRANGAWQSYRPTNTTTIAIADGGTGTVDSVRLDLWAGTNTITFATNNVTYADFAVATNAATALLYDSKLWHSDWSAFVLELP